MESAALRIELVKSETFPDLFNADGDLKEWKRVRVAALARVGETQGKFTVVLDLRARLLRVQRRDGEIRAHQVAQALLHQMCSFTDQPRRTLFHSREEGPANAEWIVLDAEHASGLLHRVQELGEFPGVSAPPVPPGLKPIAAMLLEAVQDNRKELVEWMQHHGQHGRVVHHLRFQTHTWNLVRDQAVQRIESWHLLQDLASFFDLVSGFDKSVHLVNTASPGSNPYTDALAFVSQRHQDFLRAADQLAEDLKPLTSQEV